MLKLEHRPHGVSAKGKNLGLLEGQSTETAQWHGTAPAPSALGLLFPISFIYRIYGSLRIPQNAYSFLLSQSGSKQSSKTELPIQAKLQEAFQEKGRKASNIFGLVTHPTSLGLLYICSY